MEAQLIDENTYPQHHANSATIDNVQVYILKLFQSMRDTFKDLKSNNNYSNNSNKDHLNKSDGHKDNATFENKFTGSIK